MPWGAEPKSIAGGCFIERAQASHVVCLVAVGAPAGVSATTRASGLPLAREMTSRSSARAHARPAALGDSEAPTPGQSAQTLATSHAACPSPSP